MKVTFVGSGSISLGDSKTGKQYRFFAEKDPRGPSSHDVPDTLIPKVSRINGMVANQTKDRPFILGDEKPKKGVVTGAITSKGAKK